MEKIKSSRQSYSVSFKLRVITEARVLKLGAKTNRNCKTFHTKSEPIEENSIIRTTKTNFGAIN